MSAQPPSYPFISDIVEFCQFARGNGFPVGVKETLDCARFFEAAPDSPRETVKHALRSILCSSKDDWDRFGEVFESFWNGREGDLTRPRTLNQESKAAKGSARGNKRGQVESDLSRLSENAIEAGSDSGSPEESAPSGLSASAAERLGRADFSKVSQHDAELLGRIAQRLLKRMCLRLSRRLKVETEGGIDLRRTIRRSVQRGGNPIDVFRKGKRKRQLKLVIFVDVSGSMDTHSLFLLRFAYYMQRYFKRARTFVFSTRPVDVTEVLRTGEISAALGALSKVTAGWSGGTRIGESLEQVRMRPGPELLSRDTVFIMFSDGLDTGEPDLLAREMSAIKRVARGIVWLNPLMGMHNYQPIAKGISAALPFIDLFAPAHNLDSLLQLEHRLPAITAR